MTVTCSRELSVEVAGEAAGAALFVLKVWNETLTSWGLPGWAFEVGSDLEADRDTFSLTSEVPLYRGHRVWGYHLSDEGLVPLSGVAGSALPAGWPLVSRPVCRHCGTRRARVHLLLTAVGSEGADGELFAVGESCLPAFFDVDPRQVPERRQLRFDPPTEILRAVRVVLDSEHHDTTTVIAAAMLCVARSGYVTKQQATRHGGVPTSDELTSMASSGWPAEVQERLLAAAVVRQWVLDEMPADSSFAVELRRTAGRSTVPQRSFGLLASIPSLYHRQVRREEAEAAGDPAPGSPFAAGHVGTVKERVSLADVILEESRPLPSGSTLVIFRDSQGHRLSWFASNAADLPDAGAHVRIRGTVKAHRTFRDTDETILTRVTVSSAS